MRGVGAAEREPLGLDGGVDGLGEQRPRLTAGAQGAAGEGLERGPQPRGRRRAASAAARAASTSRCEAPRKTSANRSALDGKWR